MKIKEEFWGSKIEQMIRESVIRHAKETKDPHKLHERVKAEIMLKIPNDHRLELMNNCLCRILKQEYA